jgi:DNA polymerase-3 subunit beta
MITVNRNDFVRAVTMANRAVTSWTRVPILGAVRVHANGKLEVSGTDLDTTVSAAVAYDGEPCAPFMLSDHQAVLHAINHAGGRTVGISPGDPIAITSARLSIDAKSELDAADWPAGQCDIAAQEWAATLSAETIATMLRVFPAISTEETRYYLNGIYLEHLDGWTYRATATDGHRLMCIDVPLPDAAGTLKPVILPRLSLSIIAQCFDKAQGDVRLRIGSSVARNAIDTTAPEPASSFSRFDLAGSVGPCDVRVASKTIDGHYPDYRRVIPRALDHHAEIETKPLRKAIEALSYGKRRETPALRLLFEPGGLTIRTAYGPTSLIATATVPAETMLGAKQFEIGFNGRYLIQLLGALKGERVVFGLGGDCDPCVIRDPAEPELTCVLMPMRV